MTSSLANTHVRHRHAGVLRSWTMTAPAAPMCPGPLAQTRRVIPMHT